MGRRCEGGDDSTINKTGHFGTQTPDKEMVGVESL